MDLPKPRSYGRIPLNGFACHDDKLSNASTPPISSPSQARKALEFDQRARFLMKRLSAVEKGMLLLAAMFVVFGFYLIIYPQDMVIIHPGTRGYKSGAGSSYGERVSPNASRFYGALALLLGSGIGWAVLTKKYD